MISPASPDVVFDVIADLRNHVVWSGERASDENNKLLSLEAPEGTATVGTSFTSSGTAGSDTFHDRSEVTVATRPSTFVIETDAHMDRKRGKPWDAHFVHRYDIEPDDAGSRITYTELIERVNYVPYWLQPGIRWLFKIYINRADRKQLANLAGLAAERAVS